MSALGARRGAIAWYHVRSIAGQHLVQVKHRKWDLEQYMLGLLRLPRIGSSELVLAFLEATPDACALRKQLADAKQQLQVR